MDYPRIIYGINIIGDTFCDITVAFANFAVLYQEHFHIRHLQFCKDMCNEHTVLENCRASFLMFHNNNILS